MFGNEKSRKSGLNIIVVGGGKVGATLVERLSRTMTLRLLIRTGLSLMQ